MSNVMQRDPTLIPRKPGVFMLINKRRRRVYVAYTSDLQKRSHSLAHMLQNQKTHWSIKDLPKHPAGEFTFQVVEQDVTARSAKKVVELAEEAAAKKGYKVVGGSRSAVPAVTWDGRTMPLTEAMKLARTKAKYITVWRRLDRGWTIAQALGVDAAPARWDPAQTRQRRRRIQSRNPAPPAA